MLSVNKVLWSFQLDLVINICTDFEVILKCSLQNYYKILKIYFLDTTWMSSTNPNLQSHTGVLPAVKGLINLQMTRNQWKYWSKMVPPLYHHGSTMVPPWYHHCTTMVPPWFHHGSTIVPPWYDVVHLTTGWWCIFFLSVLSRDCTTHCSDRFSSNRSLHNHERRMISFRRSWISEVLLWIQIYT